MDDFENGPLDNDFIDEEYDTGEENDFEDFEDDPVNDENDDEAEEDDGFEESCVTESRIGQCRFCCAVVILDEIPDSIVRPQNI